MATMNVSLPAGLKAWAEARAESGQYANTSDYVRDLIRRDQRRAEAIAAMQAQVDEGLKSGIGDRSMAELLDEARARSLGGATPDDGV
jgi:antitoxin ParD1/3/4